MERLVQVYRDRHGVDVSELPRAGAAGGLAGGLAAIGAELVGGFELVAEEVGLAERLEGADLVVTGEGSLDEHSLDGKVVGGVVAVARRLGVPALVICGFMLGSIGLLLSVYIRQLENFAGTMNFVIFPMFFLSSALYPLWKLRESRAEYLYWLSLANPFTHAVELVRYAAYGKFNGTALAVVVVTSLVCFLLAVLAYDPQRGLIRRRFQGS